MLYSTKYTVLRLPLIVFILCGLYPFYLNAQLTFRTQEYQRLATLLQLKVDSLHDGVNFIDNDKCQVRVIVANKQLTFMGYCLFTDEMKSIANSPVLDFLERYSLLLDFPKPDCPSERMMHEDRFEIVLGNKETFSKIRFDDDFSFHSENRKYYVEWSREGNPFLSVSFPAEHALISGENKIESEEHIETDIQQTPIGEVQPVNKELLTPIQQGKYYIRKGKSYPQNQLASDLYFQQKGDTIILLSDASHPLETAANMMLTPMTGTNYNLKVKQVMYGYKKKFFDIPLQKWIAYCLHNGCELYFGVESYDNDELKASVIAVNEAENYNHVLFVNIPSHLIAKGEGDIQVILETFIPMHNVKGLFAKYKQTNHKKQIIYK